MPRLLTVLATLALSALALSTAPVQAAVNQRLRHIQTHRLPHSRELELLERLQAAVEKLEVELDVVNTIRHASDEPKHHASNHPPSVLPTGRPRPSFQMAEIDSADETDPVNEENRQGRHRVKGKGFMDPKFKETCSPDVEYVRNDSAENVARFEELIPDIDASVKDAALTACTMLYREPSEVSHSGTIKVVIEDMDGGVLAAAGGGTIWMNSKYLTSTDDLLSTLYHEVAHIYQAYADGGSGYWTEGLADWISYSNFGWPADQPRGSYKEGYWNASVFIKWLEGKFPNFSYKLNKAMREYPGRKDDDKLFKYLTKRTVGSLWKEYQATWP